MCRLTRSTAQLEKQLATSAELWRDKARPSERKGKGEGTLALG